METLNKPIDEWTVKEVREALRTAQLGAFSPAQAVGLLGLLGDLAEQVKRNTHNRLQRIALAAVCETLADQREIMRRQVEL